MFIIKALFYNTEIQILIHENKAKVIWQFLNTIILKEFFLNKTY